MNETAAKSPPNSPADADPPAAPSPLPSIEASPALPAHLAKLADQAQGYAKAASAAATRKAYEADLRHYAGWRRRQGLTAGAAAEPRVVGLYLAACAGGSANAGGKPSCVATIERRLSALAWFCRQHDEKFDRDDPHVANVIAGIRRAHGRPPIQKEAVLPEDLRAMLATLDLSDLRALRDRAILLIGFAGGLRRSEIVGLDCGAKQTQDGSGWIEILDKGLLLTLRGKTGWREVEIGRGSSEATCPVEAVKIWLKFARISHGPLFRRVTGPAKIGADRLTDKHVARLVKSTALAAGVRGDLSERDRAQKFSGHSLRAGLASSAEVDERYVQKQLGHASAEMTRRYQRRRERFRVNLTKAAGL
jgi:integrase